MIIAVGFGLGLWVYLSHNRTCGIHPDEGLDIILWAMVGAIVGARAYYVAFQWDNYKDNLKEIFNLRGGGLAIYGGIIGALIVAFIVCRIKKLPMLPVADAAFPGVMLGQAIGRWGNFFNMEAFGTNTTLPWGMTSDTISAYLSRHQAAGRPGHYGGSHPAGTSHLPIRELVEPYRCGDPAAVAVPAPQLRWPDHTGLYRVVRSGPLLCGGPAHR